MGSLLKVLLNTIKTRIISVWTRLRYWLNISFWQSKLVTWLRMVLTKVFDVKPRHKNDYFATRNWLISRRLAYAVVIAVGIISLYLIVTIVNPIGYLKSPDGVRTYRYTSIPLRFARGKVKIKARKGYVAYVGDVNKGYATGLGELYDKDGDLVYSGNFLKNKYNGKGTLFYDNGQTKYKGDFVDNLYEGKGILYRTNGSKSYDGEFVAGMREGDGVLFDGGDNPVFSGMFHGDSIVYDQFLGKQTSEIGDMYTGTATIYTENAQSLVLMQDIDAIYVLDQGETSIDEEAIVDQVYVLSDTYSQGQARHQTIKELKEEFGDPKFEGYSYVTFPEAVGIDVLSKKENGPSIRVDMDVTTVYDEVKTVNSYLTTAELYLYVFQTENATYSFFCEERMEPSLCTA